tara:strand:+ start:347 stop:778 length:432 start_codon:yes stop_codon:yes gene_type:complete
MTLLAKNYGFPGFPSVFDDFFTKDAFLGKNTENYRPAVNVKERENDFQVELVAPGFKKGDFKLEINHDVLTISAEHVEEKTKDDKERYSLREYSKASFERTFRLPENKIDTEAVKAVYEEGILNVYLPKKIEQKAQKKLIEIA